MARLAPLGADDWAARDSRREPYRQAAPLYQPSEAASPRASGDKALPFVAFDDIEVEVRKPWILKGILARRETSSWFGGPGKGKSALLTDIAVHVASGLDWRGYRCKERCAVVILAFERADLMLRRLEAYKRRDGLKDLPIVVIRASVDIMKPESVEVLTDTIKAVEERFGLPVGLLGLDTYSKALALGGGDENAAKDVNRFLGHLRTVQNHTGVHVALIGHCGKDETRGHRGSNAHLGDVDVEVKISGSGVKTAAIEKANDQPEGPLTSFCLEAFSFGTDEDGDEITTSIVSADMPAAGQEGEAGDKPKRMNHGEQVALKMLHEALGDAGERPPASNHIPEGIGRVVTKELWRRYCYQGGISAEDTSDDARKKAFQRAVKTLQTAGFIGVWEPHVWVARHVES